MRGLREAKLANNIVWLRDGQQALDYLFREGEYAGRPPAVCPRLILPGSQDAACRRYRGPEGDQGEQRDQTDTGRYHTSSQEECDIAKSYDLGANSYIVKPIHFEGLAAAARNAGYYWVAINRPASGYASAARANAQAPCTHGSNGVVCPRRRARAGSGRQYYGLARMLTQKEAFDFRCR